MLKYFKTNLKKHTFLILIIFVFLQLPFSKSFSEESIFVVNDIEVKGNFDINFSRDKITNKAFINSFNALMSKILLSKDLEKISDIKLKKIKNLIDSFQILEENYKNEEYRAVFKISYNDKKVKKFLRNKNISFTQPKNISAIFFPILLINDEIQDFDDNYFFKNWNEIEIGNETINYIMPIVDLDDILRMKEMKNTIEELDVDNFVNKYDVKNYVFSLIDYNNNKLNIHIKTNFNDNKKTKNINYKSINIEDKSKLNSILKDIKMEVTDIWKEVNVVNLLMPLTINIKFKHTDLTDLDKIKKIFYKISIIDSYYMDRLNINHSFFKIYYYGSPKRLQTEFLKFGYKLKNDQGIWQLYSND